MVYTGKREVKDLLKFVDKEMKKAKKYRVTVIYSTTNLNITAAFL